MQFNNKIKNVGLMSEISVVPGKPSGWVARLYKKTMPNKKVHTYAVYGTWIMDMEPVFIGVALDQELLENSKYFTEFRADQYDKLLDKDDRYFLVNPSAKFGIKTIKIGRNGSLDMMVAADDDHPQKFIACISANNEGGEPGSLIVDAKCSSTALNYYIPKNRNGIIVVTTVDSASPTASTTLTCVTGKIGDTKLVDRVITIGRNGIGTETHMPYDSKGPVETKFISLGKKPSRRRRIPARGNKKQSK